MSRSIDQFKKHLISDNKEVVKQLKIELEKYPSQFIQKFFTCFNDAIKAFLSEYHNIERMAYLVEILFKSQTEEVIKDVIKHLEESLKLLDELEIGHKEKRNRNNIEIIINKKIRLLLMIVKNKETENERIKLEERSNFILKSLHRLQTPINISFCKLLDDYFILTDSIIIPDASYQRLKKDLEKEIEKILITNDKSIDDNRYYYLEYIFRHLQHNNHNLDWIIDKLMYTKEKIEDEYGIKRSFSKSIMDEVNGFVTLKDKRVNFLDKRVITIDSAGTKCFDDAFTLEKNNDNTYTLYIHITDIPSFVPYQGFTDFEALRRAETIYLSDDIINMFPFYISENVCSLIKNNNRNVITFIINFDEYFNIIGNDINDVVKIVKGKIMVTDQLSYQKADDILNGKDNNHELFKTLDSLSRICDKLRDKTKKKERYRKLENTINEITLINEGRSNESTYIDASPSANIVQELMILTNSLVAEYFWRNNHPFMYRVFEKTNNSFIQTEMSKLKENLKQQETCEEILACDEIIKKIMSLILKAKYSSKNIGHDGLGLSYYSHSSSPARRYADVIAQRLIYSFIFDENIEDKTIYLWEERINNFVEHLNKRITSNTEFSSKYNLLTRRKILK